MQIYLHKNMRSYISNLAKNEKLKQIKYTGKRSHN